MNADAQTIPAAVLGATGYVGGELLRLIAAHPRLQLAAAVSESSAGKPIGSVFPHLAHDYAAHTFEPHGAWTDQLADGDEAAVFSAAPHGASAALVEATLSALEAKNVKAHVVDSSADFRYPSEAQYEAVYGSAHGAPRLLPLFRCAVPEHAAETPTTHIGHPGCFATAVLLASVPLLQSGLCNGELFVSAVTGSTGSGRSPQQGTHHPERHSNLYAYKPLQHRHTPEIERLAAAAAGTEVKINFIPHSGPFARGIYATVQAKCDRDVTAAAVKAAFTDAYANAPFVEVVDGSPKLKNVVASNRCQIGVDANGGTLVVMSAIDNLVKGAAGGAVQWMNRLFSWPEETGLTTPTPAWT